MVNSFSDSAPADYILILSDDSAFVSPIAAHLNQENFKTVTRPISLEGVQSLPQSAPSCVIFHSKDAIPAEIRLAAKLKSEFDRLNVPFIGLLPRGSEMSEAKLVFDTIIVMPAHPVQALNRIRAMMRLKTIETELSLRIDTLTEDFDLDYDLAALRFDEPYRVLFIGKATPEFLVVINALENRDAEVVAAFSSFSAFDFLQEHDFDSVVINTLDNPETALGIAALMRRNSRLYHVPTIFLTPESFPYRDKAFNAGVSDIIPWKSDMDDMSGRILELANYHRLHRQLKTHFQQLGSSACFDAASGVYSREFANAHCRRLCRYYGKENLPVSMLTVNLDASDNQDREALLGKIGALLKNVVRMEDTVARLSETTFAVLFPGQTVSVLHSVTDRVKDIIEKSILAPHKRHNPGQSLSLNVRLIPWDPEENAWTFLDRAQQVAQQPESDADFIDEVFRRVEPSALQQFS